MSTINIDLHRNYSRVHDLHGIVDKLYQSSGYLNRNEYWLVSEGDKLSRFNSRKLRRKISDLALREVLHKIDGIFDDCN